MYIKPTQHNLDILLYWKQKLEDLLKDHSLLGHFGLCGYLECKNNRILYLHNHISSYRYICEFMDNLEIAGYSEASDLGEMSVRRILLTQQLLTKIKSDIYNIQSNLG